MAAVNKVFELLNATASSVITFNTQSDDNNDDNNSNKKTKLSIGAIIGISVGVAFICILNIIGIYYYSNNKSKYEIAPDG